MTEDNLKEFIFTFGYGHTPNQNYFVAIKAEDSLMARREMISRFGTKWAFQYPSRQAAGVDKYNLQEYKI